MIHAAVESKDLEKVKAAIAAGANVNQLDHRGWSPLLIAASVAPIELVKTLLEAGARPNVGNGSVVAAAVRRKDDAMLELLLRSGADVNAAPNPELRPLRIALAHSAKQALVLIEKGARLTADLVGLVVPVPGTPQDKEKLLAAAIEKQPTAVLRSLIEYVDDASLDTLIPLAIKKGALLAPTEAVSPLHLAAGLLKARAAKALLAAGASTETPLDTDWFRDDEDQNSRFERGLTVRALFERLAKEELKSKPSKGRRDRLEATAKALGVKLKSEAPREKVTLEGEWHEVQRISKSDDYEFDRSERVLDGGTVVLTSSTWEVKGHLGCGLTGKGVRKALSFNVKGDDPLQANFDGEHLSIASWPDDEHGLVVTSVFEKVAGNEKPAKKALAKKSAPAKKPAPKKKSKR